MSVIYVSVLSDLDIERLMRDGKLYISNFRDDSLTPNGYDVSVSEVVIGESVYNKEEQLGNECVEVPGDTHFLISTDEYFELPDFLVADIWIRTTWARKGVISSFGFIDAGFSGTLTLSAYNSGSIVHIDLGDRFAQVVFRFLSSESLKNYNERSGNYQGERGVVVSPDDIEGD